MSPPTVRVNNFVPMKETSLDLVSKAFIIFELIFGINRLPVFGKMKHICLAISLTFSLSINILVIYLTYNGISNVLGEFVRLLKLWQYCMCAILAFAFRKRLRDFFLELIKFDNKTGFRIKNKDVIKSFVEIFLTMCILMIIMYVLHMPYILNHYNIDVIITLLINIFELHFFGHLLCLFIPRLRFINHLMKQSLCNHSGIRTVQQGLISSNKTKHSPTDMKKMMDFYHRIIITYDMLYEAIKWQMIVILVTSYITSLTVSYVVILRYIHNESSLKRLLIETILAACEMVPMFLPCRIVDILRGEVRCLIELLSSKLYENKIEKSSRAVAQAFLGMMEARDLSFSLLRIIDIDVSFPLRFLALLVTYLIILLQFDKVINVDRSVV